MLDPAALRARLAAYYPDPDRPERDVPKPDPTASAVLDRQDAAAPVGSAAASGLSPRPPVPAAVLVPILTGPLPSVLLTKRTPHLSSHAGQVSFPGGRIDPGDASPEDA